MKVQDLMSKEPRAVRVFERLTEAARILWEQDCGFVPVIDSEGGLVGVVTDRDLCMASYTQGKPVAEMSVSGVMARSLTTCQPDHSIADAMKAMSDAQVHRLPVVDAQGLLVGVLSSNDLLQLAASHPDEIVGAELLMTLAAVRKPRSGTRQFTVSSQPPVSSKSKSGGNKAAVEASAPAVRKVKKEAPKAVAKPAAKASDKSRAKPAAKIVAKAAAKPAAKVAAKPASRAAKARSKKDKL